MISESHYLVLAFLLFAIGLFGALTRRNLILILLSIEIMFNAIHLIFVTFSRTWNNLDGQVAALFSMAVAAAEVAVGLAIAILLFRSRKTIDASQFNSLKD
ncbi:MAG: NADH-quinone oxidoreductase subunit NuoK [Candidatus Omnitrophica bacterium]|nr:NADH-quinone oxidoreductase subunit NuoK [Candidatus Omnitrophota bacterium]